MKNVTLAMLVMASIAPLCGMAQQKVKVDVHTGANISSNDVLWGISMLLV